MDIRVKKIKEDAILPTKGSVGAAGYDLYANVLAEVMVIPPHTTNLIGTGLAMQIPKGYFGAIVARSGLATKRGLRPANCIGIIDSDYRGEIKVALHNDTNENQAITNKERIAQLIIMPFINVSSFIITDELQDTSRGEGGFGSTGT